MGWTIEKIPKRNSLSLLERSGLSLGRGEVLNILSLPEAKFSHRPLHKLEFHNYASNNDFVDIKF